MIFAVVDDNGRSTTNTLPLMIDLGGGKSTVHHCSVFT